MSSTQISSKDSARRSKHFGPYRATKLWNELLRAFRSGMPVRKHRRHMKSYEDCFSGNEAVAWILDHLRNNPNYGSNVTKNQAVQLLDKFHKWRVFEDVRGQHKNGEAFTDSGRLYKFIPEAGGQTPAKPRTMTPSRVPLATRTALMNGANSGSPQLPAASKSLPLERLKPLDHIMLEPENETMPITANTKLALANQHNKGLFDGVSCTGATVIQSVSHHGPVTRSMDTVQRRDAMATKNAPRPSSMHESSMGFGEELTDAEVHQVWKTMLLNRLQNVLRVRSLTDILNADEVVAKHIIHNMTHVHNGVVSNIKEQDQLPQWVIRAMRYLAYWPASVEDVPRYDGFVRDVFNAITDDYFSNLRQPLCSTAMFDIFNSVIACLEEQEPVRMPSPPSPVLQTANEAPHYSSLESLMHDLTMDALSPPPTRSSNNPHSRAFPQSPMRPSDIMIVHDSEVLTRTMPDIIQTCTESEKKAKMHKYHSAGSLSDLSGPRYETSFGVNSPEPRTRLVSTTDIPISAKTDINSNHYDAHRGTNSSRRSMEHTKSMVDIRHVETASNRLIRQYSTGQASDRAQQSTDARGGVGLARSSWSDPRRAMGLTGITNTTSPRPYVSQGSSPGSQHQPRIMSKGGARKSISPTDESSRRMRSERVSSGSVSSDVFMSPPSLSSPLFTEEERRHLGIEAEQNGGQKEDPSRYPQGGYRPRTCPMNGTYRSTSAITDMMVKSIAQVPPPYVPPPRYTDQVDGRTNSAGSSSGRSSAYHNTYTPPSHSTKNPKVPVNSATFFTANRSGPSAIQKPKQTQKSNEPRREEKPVTRSTIRSERNLPSQAFMDRMNREAKVASRSASERSSAHSLGRAAGRRCQLTESYLMATDRDNTVTTPLGKSLFSTNNGAITRAQSSPNLAASSDRLLEALQLCLLMLPPADRRKLHLLLRFIHKLAHNQQLVIVRATPTSQLVISTFWRCIVHSTEDTELNRSLCAQIVSFMVEHYVDLMSVPASLRNSIEAKLADLRSTKREFFRAGFEHGVTYCRQVSLNEYERQRHSTAHTQLLALLNAVLDDKKMSAKEKKKRLKQFQRAHPDVYQRRFPNSRSESQLANLKPAIKQPLLTRPLTRLKSLRL